MPEGIETWVEDGFATIGGQTSEKRAEVLRKLLESTPVALIETITRSGPYKLYRVPEGNARDAGLIDGPTDTPYKDRKDLGYADAIVAANPFTAPIEGHGQFTQPVNTVKGSAYGAAPSTESTVTNANVNSEPTESNGHITGPLRPNQPVVDAGAVPQPPAIADIGSADLQALVKANTPQPADYAPTKVPLSERVPSAQATIAATVDREPAGPSEPASGIGIGPVAGRVTDQGVTDLSSLTIAQLRIEAQQRGVDLGKAKTKPEILAKLT